MSENNFLLRHTQILCDSYRRWTGRLLIEGVKGERLEDALYEAPFAVVSHGTEADPMFNYANLQAQQLFKMTWDEFAKLPSRFSAEPVAREARAGLLARVERYGYIDNYSGVRIAKDGSRFMIRDATVWNLLDEQGKYYGQAAKIAEWKPV